MSQSSANYRFWDGVPIHNLPNISHAISWPSILKVQCVLLSLNFTKADTNIGKKLYFGLHVVVESLFIVAHIVCGGSVFGPWLVIQDLMGKRELVALP